MILRSVFLRRLEAVRDAHLELRLPDGSKHEFGERQSGLHAEIEVRRDRFFQRALFGGDVGVGDAFVDGDWDTPDLVSVVRLAVRNRERLANIEGPLAFGGWAMNRLQHWRNRNTLNGSRRNISAHYDLSNEFFSCFLGRGMVYSSGIFEHEHRSLEDAQVEKIDRICRKLNLSCGDHLLEIGTGWGAFALHAAQHYGCRVTTTTISRQQYDYSASLFAQYGMENRIHLLQEDYRRLQGQYDKIASIEMFEAVGLDRYDEFFGICDRLLKPGGVLAMQSITMNEHRFRAYRLGTDWIQQRIFPGGQLASIRAIQDSLVRATSLGLHHLEDIGMHYAHTLQHWRSRVAESKDKIRELGFDHSFLRAWNYYLAYCEGAFRERYIGNVQLVLAKQGTQLPLPGEPWRAQPQEHRKGAAA